MILPACNGNRISVLGEFGGMDGPSKNICGIWYEELGYKNIDGAMALMDNYGRLVYDLGHW